MCKNVTTAMDAAATVGTAAATTTRPAAFPLLPPKSYKAMLHRIISVNYVKMKSYMTINIHIYFVFEDQQNRSMAGVQSLMCEDQSMLEAQSDSKENVRRIF